MKYKQNWEQTKIKLNNWWNRKNTGRPVIHVIAEKQEQLPLPNELQWSNCEDSYTNADKLVKRYRHFCENNEFLGESFPNLSVDFGPGSLAAYLGSEIEFHKDTVWFEKCVNDWSEIPKYCFDGQNKWFKRHMEVITRAKELVSSDFFVAIPDLMENVDVLASLRGAQELIFDMMDEPDEITKRIEQIQGLYFDYYDRFYNIVKDSNDGSSCYTAFQIWGYGKIAKLQCDFSAMLSPTQFRGFIVPDLRKQAKCLDKVLYHLDGPDAIKHVDALMEIEEIDALQWTSGSYNPDGLSERWYDIYDKTYKAGKSLWVQVYSGGFDEWITAGDRFIARYGSERTFFLFPRMNMSDADKLLRYAEKSWSDVKAMSLS